MKWVLAFIGLAMAATGYAEPSEARNVIQSAGLDATRPYFIPCHQRVTTTVRFPGPIGAPEGSVSVFTENATANPAEVLVAWQQGDAHFAVTPLKPVAMANLNVPYQGATYVFYFHQASDPLQAVACVNLTASGDQPGVEAARSRVQLTEPAAAAIRRSEMLPDPGYRPATAARLVGFLDRLKLLHALAGRAELPKAASSMGLEVAISREAGAHPVTDERSQAEAGAAPGIPVTGMNDSGLYQVILVCAVRDPRINCVGFICLVRNTSDSVLVFDVASFGARAGTQFLGQRLSDATPTLQPGEQAPAYFIVQPSPARPLLADNEWKLSVELVSPRLNPGAAITRGFGKGGEP